MLNPTLPIKVGRDGGKVVLTAASSSKFRDQYKPASIARIPSLPSLIQGSLPSFSHCSSSLTHCTSSPASKLAGTDPKKPRLQGDTRPNLYQNIPKPEFILVPRSWCHQLCGPVPIQPIGLLWLTWTETVACWGEAGWSSACSPVG